MKFYDSIALIPMRAKMSGPVTQAKIRRTLFMYFAVAVLGFTLWFHVDGFLSPFGLGLVLPGAGFLGYLSGTFLQIIGQLLLFVLTNLFFLVGLFLWFATGNILAPFGVWGGAALVAGSMNALPKWAGGGWVVGGIVFLLAIKILLSAKKSYKEALRNRERRNQYLERRRAEMGAGEMPGTEVAPPVSEMSETMLGFLRYSLDLALQPVDSYTGFSQVDQFQTSAYRYQICTLGYSLAVVNNSCTPAFRGYLAQAQRNLHDKMLDHRNWAYWVKENAWGNLRYNPDPIPKDNIMYTGWYSALLLEYVSNTGDTRYEDAPLILRHPSGKLYEYTLKNIVEIMYRQFNESDFCLWPCEPNWIYAMCNNYGIIALSIYDRLYKTEYWTSIRDNYRKNLENEFITFDGRAIGIRSSRTGLTIPALTSVMADAVTAYHLNGVLPDIARRCWEIARLDYMTVKDGKVELKTRGWDAADVGNYKKSMITTYLSVAATAAEMNDMEVAEILRRTIESEFEFSRNDGAISIPSVSNLANIAMMQVYGTTPNSKIWLQSKGMPAARKKGPLLSDAPYPDVMVALANNDGGRLDLVLRPGRPAAVGREFELSLSQLDPQRGYRCSGVTANRLVADSRGEAKVRIVMGDRQVVQLSPE